MGTTEAQNYLKNTKLRFEFKLLSAAILTATFAIIIFIENVLRINMNKIGDFYFIAGVVLLVATGGVFKLIKIVTGCFAWGFLLTPFKLFDLVIALCAGGMALGTGVLFPMIPIALDTLDLYRERRRAKEYL